MLLTLKLYWITIESEIVLHKRSSSLLSTRFIYNLWMVVSIEACSFIETISKYAHAHMPAIGAGVVCGGSGRLRKVDVPASMNV
jgi:hypothetical protein